MSEQAVEDAKTRLACAERRLRLAREERDAARDSLRRAKEIARLNGRVDAMAKARSLSPTRTSGQERK